MASPNRPQRGRRILILILLLAAAYFAYRHFAGHPAAPAGGMPQMPPASVGTVTVHPQDTALTYEYAGRITGSRENEIRARVSGILLQRSYTEGAAVKRGDLLFRIDPAPFIAAFNEAQAKLVQTQRDWQRASKLKKDNAISAREFDLAESAYHQAKAQADTAKINLGYTTVRAPISGITSHESVTEGTLVQADTTVLTHVSQLDPIYIYFGSPDDETLQLRQKIAEGKVSTPKGARLKAEIHLADGTNYPQLASVDFTDSIIDPATGTVSMRAVVGNRSNTLLPGQFVRIFLKGLVAKGAFGIPDKAVMQGPPGTFVYTVGEGNKAAITPVVLGKLNGETRLVESGLKDGDVVITEGMIKVQPGAPVQIAPPPQDNNAGAPATPPTDKKG